MSALLEAAGPTAIAAARNTYGKEIERVEAEGLKLPQVDCPLKHHFAPGVYLREIFMPAGTFIVGAEHLTEHLNIVSQGRARVMMDGVIEEIVAPCTFKSGVGVRKILLILEDMIWSTVHVTEEADLLKLENLLIKKTPVHLAHEHAKEMQNIRAMLEKRK